MSQKKVSLRRGMEINMAELPAQMVMDFFAQGFPITDTPEHVVLKKSNDAIKVVGNTLGLLSRRIIDACFYIARQTHEMGATSNSGMYSVPYDYFIWLISFDSKNITHLKRKIGDILKTPIEINIVDINNPDKDFWLKTNFLYDVCIASGRVYFGIPESIRQSILNPRSFTNLSLRITNNFSSLYAYILYTRCRSELYRGITEWWDMESFRAMMNTANLYPELQDLHKRVIYPAIAQINNKSDIYITPDYQLKGRTKTHIRFLVETNPEFAETIDKERLPKDIFEILKAEFGLSNSQVDEVARYPIDYLVDKIEFSRHRIKNAKVKINRPDAYLLNAVKEDLRFNKGEKEEFEKQQKALDLKAQEVVKTEKIANEARAKNASLDRFNALDENEQTELLNAFRLSQEFEPVKSMVKGALTVKSLAKRVIVEKAFAGWLQSQENEQP